MTHAVRAKIMLMAQQQRCHGCEGECHLARNCGAEDSQGRTSVHRGEVKGGEQGDGNSRVVAAVIGTRM